eukprot:TRINITY_DN1636_c0_g1_i2.p1 TRINITY_DN1636_c0_g1~~TRINITY_DN1636_c0_g1_i2.p1  ORF type:complete len:133 (-),score=37.87 TRINITY_DN1636_c0_g1_i2:45-443(-)
MILSFWGVVTSITPLPCVGSIMSSSYNKAVNQFWTSYQVNTPQKLKIIDVFLLYILITGIVQFAYCVLVGTFPFNSFLAGFISTVGTFILTVCLRIQVNPSQTEIKTTPERAFADFLFCNLILHLVVFNFMG